MNVKLTVTAGPHVGKEFSFDRHDTFLVGRSSDSHLKLNYDDPYFSRRHFLFEVNPPRVRLIDLNSRNGTMVNGKPVRLAELKDQDEIKAGHTIFKLTVPEPPPDELRTLHLPATSQELTTDSAQSVVSSASLPFAIPGYQLEKELGRGGMGVVYQAVRTSDQKPVAIKAITVAPGVSQRQTEKFLREAQILANLKHPAIIAHIDNGMLHNVVYLVMELIQGADARTLVQDRGPLPVTAAVKILIAVLHALEHAHGQGIVHRDVKPANVLVGKSGTKRVAKLADFGLARAFAEYKLSGLTFQGEVGGTPAFMAPEQVTHYREVKPPADQYAAAATLYFLLTGTFPHDLPKNISGQLAVIVTEEPVEITKRRPELPVPLAQVIHRALAREAEDRYPDVRQFRAALLKFLPPKA